MSKKETKYILNYDGEIGNCYKNVSKMKWYEYARYFGSREVKYWYKEYFSEITDVSKKIFMLFFATLLIPFTPLIYPFVWSRRIRKAKKEMDVLEKNRQR